MDHRNQLISRLRSPIRFVLHPRRDGETIESIQTRFPGLQVRYDASSDVFIARSVC